MAVNLLIPRLEWAEVTFELTTTSGSDIISGISDTSGLRAGMYVSGSGIPAETTIITKTSSQVKLSAAATASALVDISFYERFDFSYPPKLDSDDRLTAKNKVTESLSGLTQVQHDNIEAVRDLEFWFLTTTEYDRLRKEFFLRWASRGFEFRYFPDQDDTDVYETYELNQFKFETQRQVKKHPDFLRGLKMQLRRIVEYEEEETENLLTEDLENIVTEDGDNIVL